MIALCVRTLETPVPCEAANSLTVARSELIHCRYIEAGRALRRALREYLVAECRYNHCLPDGRKSTQALADALLQAEFLAEFGHAAFGEMEDVAANAIAGRLVPLSKFCDVVDMLDTILSDCPYPMAVKGGRA